MSYSSLSDLLDSVKILDDKKYPAMFNFMNMLIVVSDRECTRLLLANEVEEMYEVLLNTHRSLEQFVGSEYGVRS